VQKYNRGNLIKKLLHISLGLIIDL